MAANESETEFLVGVDLGATKIYAAVFDPQFSIVGSAKLSTKPQRGPEAILDRIAKCVREAIDESDLNLKQIRAIGIGAPGIVDTAAGVVISAPSLDWKDIALKKELEKRLDLPLVAENSYNCCTLGVHTHELKEKPAHLVGMFIGAGIGGGIIIDRQLYTGTNRAAGEMGHIIVQAGGPKCRCGNEGCLEALASRAAMFRKITSAVKAGQKTVLTELLGTDLQDLRSGDLRRAIRRGDKYIESVVTESAQYIGLVVGSLINLLNPEVIALGGGVIEALETEMMPTVLAEARERVLPGTMTGIRILASSLGDHAGVVGAAVLASRKLSPSAVKKN